MTLCLKAAAKAQRSLISFVSAEEMRFNKLSALLGAVLAAVAAATPLDDYVWAEGNVHVRFFLARFGARVQLFWFL